MWAARQEMTPDRGACQLAADPHGCTRRLCLIVQQAFHRRITFCLDVHNEAVKSMRFPAKSYKDLQSGGDRCAPPPTR